MRVLVTGAAGGVGTEVVARLSEKHDVIGVDRMMGTAEGITWHVGDIVSDEFLADVAQGVDVIVHLAGIPIFDEALNNEIADLNIIGTQRVFETAARQRVKRIVQASSICATGMINRSSRQIPASFPLDETYTALPDDLYGLSKLVSEQLAAAYELRYGIEHTDFRMATVWRPNHGATDALLRELLLPAYDGNLAYRDLRWQYLDVRDAAEAFVKAVEADRGFGVVNLGAADNPGSDWRLWIYHAYPEINRENLPSPDKPDVALWSIGKAEREFGYAPQFTWRDYPVFVEAFTEHRERLASLANVNEEGGA